MFKLSSSSVRPLIFGLGLLLTACAPASEVTEDDTDDQTNEASSGNGSSGKDAGAKDASKSKDAKAEADDDDGDGSRDARAATGSDAGAVGASKDAQVDEPIDETQSLLPFQEGNTWTYRVSGGTGMAMKVTTVGALEKVGGTGPNKDKMAFKVTTTKGAMDRTVSWQAVVGSSVLRYREIAYSATTGEAELEEHWVPHKLHVHSDAEHRKSGFKWVETYMETKAMTGAAPVSDTSADNWSVDAAKVSVTVPAGTFQAVVLIKASPSGQKTYWYVPGVGKVKETGGQTEELVSFKVAPAAD